MSVFREIILRERCREAMQDLADAALAYGEDSKQLHHFVRAGLEYHREVSRYRSEMGLPGMPKRGEPHGGGPAQSAGASRPRL